MITYYKTTSKVKSLTDSKKKTFRLVTSNTISPSTGWSGGSCEYHSLANIIFPEKIPVLKLGNQFNIHAEEQALEKDCILITTGIFYGKPSVPTITCREDQVEEIRQFLGITEKDQIKNIL